MNLSKNTFKYFSLGLAAIAIIFSGCSSATSGSGSSESDTNSDYTSAKSIVLTLQDKPTGFASYNAESDFAGSSGTVYTVSNRTELVNALKASGKKVIYVNGIIDMSEGMIPPAPSKNTYSDKYSTQALDNWIKKQVQSLTDTSTYGDVASEVTSFATWKTWYAGNLSFTSNESGVYAKARSVLSTAWGKQISVTMSSDTTLIGKTQLSGIKGGSIQISDKNNIAIRNLIINDPFDPFPQVEKNDGFNANWDYIQIQNSTSKNIWIDHCTFQDTIFKTDEEFDHVYLSGTTSSSSGVIYNSKTGKYDIKYQVYDGIMDIKKQADYITVSNCVFANHDKVSIIGHSDDYSDDDGHLTITLHHNYYINCTQRLPRVRFAKLHTYNNFYTNDKTTRSNSYCFGVGKEAKIYAEGNYFSSGINNSAKLMSTSTPGYIYFDSSNTDNSKGFSGISSTAATWTPSTYYSYTVDKADSALISSVKSNAGAGCLVK